MIRRFLAWLRRLFDPGTSPLLRREWTKPSMDPGRRRGDPDPGEEIDGGQGN